MSSVYSKRIRSKKDSELIQLLRDRSLYENEVVNIALDEIKKREILNGQDSPIDIQNLILQTDEEITKKAIRQKAKINKKASKPNYWSWLPWPHLLDLIGYYSLCLIILVVFSFPYFHENIASWPLLAIMFVFPLWQGQLLSNEQTKRFFHFHERIVYSCAVSLFFVIKTYFFANKFNLDLLWIFLVLAPTLMVLSGIISAIVYALPLKKLNERKWYFMNRLRLFISICVLILICLVIMEEGWFIKKKRIVWDENKPLTVDDFRGYPDFFTHYDGAISSFIDYEFDEQDQLTKLEAVCNSHNTWINPWDKDSYNLLQHEQYHFNATEVVTRMARKCILDTMKYGTDREGLESILIRHRNILNEIQDQYDDESNHSMIRDMQGYWQFKIDSFLYELDPYWTSQILKSEVMSDTIKYYRFITSNARNELIGINPLLNGEQAYTAHYRFNYSNSGFLNKIEVFNLDIRSIDDYYKTSSIIRLKDFDLEILEFRDINDALMKNNNGYAIQKSKKRDGSIELNYFDSNGERCKNKNGAYSTIIKLDAIGRFDQKSSFDENGELVTLANGVDIIKYYYFADSSLFHSSIKYFDDLMNPIINNDGIHERIYTRDVNGRTIFEGKLDLNNRYVMNERFAYKKREYDELGYYTKLTAFDSSANLVQMSERNAILSWSYDRYGNINRVSSYNANGVLVADEDGIASYYYKFDNNGNNIVAERYGTGDEMIFEDGYGKEVYEYDSLNRLLLVKNYDAYGYPTRSKYNSFCYKIFRDSLTQQSEVLFYNMEIEPDTTSDGAHRILQKFDTSRNLLEKSFYNLSNQLVAVEQDVAVFQYDYDERNNKIESRFYNVDRKLAVANQGVSINKYYFLKNNWMTERTYHDSLGNLEPFDGVAKIKWVHDKKGNEIEEWRYNKFDHLLDSGIAVIKNKYDGNGNKIEIRNFDHTLNLIKSEAAIVQIEHNKYNEIILEKYLDHLGRPSIYNKENVHIYEYLYDDNNYYLGKRFKGVDGNLKEIDGIAHIVNKPDMRGNTLSTSYLNSSSNLTLDENGVSIYTYEYDLNDRQISFAYQGPDSLVGKYNGYFSRANLIRDRAGNIIRKVHYNEFGDLTINSDSVALYINKYNRNGKITTWSYTIEEALIKLNVDNN